MKTLLRHASSFFAPLLVCIVIPYFILAARPWPLALPPLASPLPAVLGALAALIGLVLASLSFRLVIRIGKGTIMPWDPSRKLVVAGLYRYVRNPMILSILIILAGEALAFASTGIYILAVIFYITNTLYFRLSEEPGLEKRFGEEYLEYRRNVPRWLPRTKPWDPSAH